MTFLLRAIPIFLEAATSNWPMDEGVKESNQLIKRRLHCVVGSNGAVRRRAGYAAS